MTKEEELKLEITLLNLVDCISVYNKRDMLEGYLNPIADLFNSDLKELGINTIEKYNSED